MADQEVKTNVHRVRAEGVREGLQIARELVAREAQQEFIDGHGLSAEALRQVYLKLVVRVKDHDRALEGDEADRPEGL